MRNNEQISHKSILYELIGLLSIRNTKNDYKDEYLNVFNSIGKRIKEAKCIVAGENDVYKVNL